MRARLLSSTSAAAAASVQQQPSWRKNLTGRDNAKLIGKRDAAWWFTGTLPQNTPGFDGKYLRSLPVQHLHKDTTRESAQAFFDNGWTLYETLFASLQTEEAFFIPPAHGLRHSMQFYYGHTAALYLNKLLIAGLIPRTIDRAFEAQFEVGVDEMRWDDDLSEGRLWPSVSEVRDFRKETYDIVSKVVAREFDSKPRKVGWNDPLWSFFMACEHDRIHLETSAVLIRELPTRLVSKPDYFPEPYSSSAAASHEMVVDNEMIKVQGETVQLGKARDFPTYGWDNEYGKLETKVGDFNASKFLVSNHEFLQFVLAKGYVKQEYWSKEGWEWRRYRNTQHPKFWINSGPQGLRQDFKLRHLFEEREMDWSLPVICNYHEAKAFCNWKGSKVRLLTEAEHQLVLNRKETAQFAEAEAAGSVAAPANSGLAYGGETPVHLLGPNRKGFFDAMGNVWQWTEDTMQPLPGFEPHEYYLDFTEPCFDGKHQVIKGGSFVSTCDNGVSPHARFHFRAHFHQMSGFRYCEPLNAAVDNVYETDALVEQYLDLHFKPARALEFAGRFPQRCAELVIKYSKQRGSALDVGCAVGGAAFELTKAFDKVVGVDYSQAFVDLANEMKQNAGLQVKGEFIPCPSDSASRATFYRGDACDLHFPNEERGAGPFDAILAANLLCRLQRPADFLQSLPALVNSGGIVVLVSPYSWLEEFTPAKQWFGRVGNSEKELVQRMTKDLGFELVHEEDMPLVIREHARKYQYIVSHACVFRKP